MLENLKCKVVRQLVAVIWIAVLEFFHVAWWWWWRWWMLIVDLYSALRRAPLLRYVSRCVVKRNVFSADRKYPMLSDGLRRWSGSRFQTIGPATENARRPNQLHRWCGGVVLMASGRSKTLTTGNVWCNTVSCHVHGTVLPVLAKYALAMWNDNRFTDNRFKNR